MGIRIRLAFSAAMALAMTGGVALATTATTATTAVAAAGSPAAAPMVREGICTAPVAYKALAARLSADS